MTATWIWLCSGLFLFQASVKTADITDGDFTEGSRVSISCKFDDTRSRFWYKAMCNASISCPPDTDILFAKDAGKLPMRKNDNLSDGMDIDNGTFALIINQARIQDEGIFTCKKCGAGPGYEPHRVRIYVQPADSDIQISGVDGTLTEGDNVTASCTVNRLYPEIASAGSFDITWGDNTNSSYEKHDPVGADKAFKYTVTITKTLNSSDNGTTIQCDLQPEIGTAAYQRKTVLVKRDAPVTVMENSTAILECGIQEEYTYRYWFTGYFNETIPPPGGNAKTLFEQFQRDPVSKITERSDISADKVSFALTIGSVMLDDDGYFTCASRYGSGVWISKPHRIQVYIQPADSDLQIGGIDGDLTEGDVVTASCTVNRLYPEIASVGLFSITWGDSTNSHYEKHNPVGTDKAFKYTVTMTKILKSSDNGTTIQCDLHPEIGTAVYQKETVIVNYDARETVMENSTAVLECGIQEQYTYRYWFTGYFNETIPPPGGNAKTLSEQFQRDSVSKITERSDMSADEVSFAVTFGIVKLDDDGFFTCASRYGTDEKIYKPHRIQVYIQPADSDIQISLVHGDLTEGDVVTASCTVNRLYPEITSVGSFSITWGENTNSNYKKHDPVGADKAFKYTVTMTKTLNSSDNGTTIQCDLQPEIGTSVQQKKTVTVKYKPIGSPQMSVNEPHPIPSSDVTFTCDFTNMDANPGVDSVQWFKDEETLTWSDSSFHIKDVNADNNGNYGCRVGNAIGLSNVSNQIELSVNYSAFYAPRGSPDLSIYNCQPIEGDSVTLNCSTSNIDSYFPLISSNWIKDGVPHTEWANESIIDIEVKQTDSANYSCSVGNFIGNSGDADAVYLDVLHKPIGSPQMSVNEPHPIPSSDVTFTCDFTNMDANPGVDSVQWFKDEETLTWSDSSFHIKDVNADDNGNYSCRVGNAIAYSNVSNQIELSVNYSAFYAPRGSPDVIIDNTQPIEGESVILNCSISNIDSYFPLISSNWVKDGVPHTEWANESIINIEVKQTDSANYSCSVGNFIGNSVDADAVYLDVLHGPTRNPVLNVNVTGEVNEGDYVSLTCDISGIDSNPELTIVKWTKDGQDIDWPDTSFTHTIEVTATDHGKYGCKVGNVIKGSPTYSGLSGLVKLKVKGGGG